jgi:hypothetical protein
MKTYEGLEVYISTIHEMDFTPQALYPRVKSS